MSLLKRSDILLDNLTKVFHLLFPLVIAYFRVVFIGSLIKRGQHDKQNAQVLKIVQFHE